MSENPENVEQGPPIEVGCTPDGHVTMIIPTPFGRVVIVMGLSAVQSLVEALQSSSKEAEPLAAAPPAEPTHANPGGVQ